MIRGETSTRTVTADFLQPGTLLSKTYKVVRLLGEGGAGMVYEARHRKLGHPVAIKVLFQHLARHPTIRARFVEEAQIQAQLRHQNLVRVVDIIDDGQQSVAMVMEYVAGRSLDQFIDEQQPVPFEDSVRLMEGVLAGLGFAHKEGVVHRDIKPENVLIEGSDPMIPKLSDFGIAKVVAADKRTVTGTKMGTVAYMAPEQVVDSSQVDERADIYALGVTLFELVTGRLPFDSDNVYVVMNAHRAADVPPPSRFRKDLPPGLERVILKAMAKRPDDRFDSCEAMAEALRRVDLNAAVADTLVDLAGHRDADEAERPQKSKRSARTLTVETANHEPAPPPEPAPDPTPAPARPPRPPRPPPKAPATRPHTAARAAAPATPRPTREHTAPHVRPRPTGQSGRVTGASRPVTASRWAARNTASRRAAEPTTNRTTMRYSAVQTAAVERVASLRRQRLARALFVLAAGLALYQAVPFGHCVYESQTAYSLGSTNSPEFNPSGYSRLDEAAARHMAMESSRSSAFIESLGVCSTRAGFGQGHHPLFNALLGLTLLGLVGLLVVRGVESSARRQALEQADAYLSGNRAAVSQKRPSVQPIHLPETRQETRVGRLQDLEGQLSVKPGNDIHLALRTDGLHHGQLDRVRVQARIETLTGGRVWLIEGESLTSMLSRVPTTDSFGALPFVVAYSQIRRALVEAGQSAESAKAVEVRVTYHNQALLHKTDLETV